MAPLNRRAFLGRLLAGAAAVAAAPLLAHLPAPPPKPLEFAWHPDAFALAFDDTEIQARYIQPAAQALADRIDRGIAIRYMREFNVLESRRMDRLDVLFGTPNQTPFACRVVG